MTFDLAAIRRWTTANLRARAAYNEDQRVAEGRCAHCGRDNKPQRGGWPVGRLCNPCKRYHGRWGRR
jgi:hypothetical protein